MNRTKGNSREFLQQATAAIDAKIKSLEESFVESVTVLKLERNTLVPVSSLPPEILAAIFSFLCLSGKPSLGRDSGHHRSRIRLSHVCHQWREIALNQSLLWSHVDFSTLSLAGAAEILARAKSAPLYLEASWKAFRFNTFRKEVQARIPHICHLGIRAKNVHLHNALSSLKKSPAPILEYLSLFSTEDSYSANVFIPDTLFDGSAPRLSCLKLRHCGMSWKQPLWPLLKGLKCLEILRPSINLVPKLADWLGALAEMPKLEELTLQRASPEAPPVPFDVERIVTLPSLKELNIETFWGECVLALAHLDLPALDWLSLEAICVRFPKSGDVQELLPYVARFADGIQHTQPLQSMLIRNDGKCIDMLAWHMPDIGAGVNNNPPTLLGARHPPHLALSIRCDDAYDSASGYYSHLELLDWLITGLPLDGIVMLAAQDLCSRTRSELVIPAKQFWLHISPKIPKLRRVRLSLPALGGFAEMLLEDNEERERPLLPSLTELILVDVSYLWRTGVPLCDALMKRVKQGVPLEVLDLRMSRIVPGAKAELGRLSEIVVNVLPVDPKKSKHMRSLWKPVPLGVFLDDNARYDSQAETDSDAEEDDDSEEE